MPYIRRRYRRRFKRPYKRYVRKSRKYYRRRYKRRRYLPFTGEGNKKLVKLKYCTNIFLDANSGDAVEYIFSANGLYDPDVTGSGHQPRGFDQQMEYFEHYTVLGSKCTVKMVPLGVSNVNPSAWTIVLSSSQSPFVNYNEIYELMEARMGTSKFGVAGIYSGYSNSPVPLTSRKFSSKRFFGPNYLDKDYSGSAASNPAEQAYYHIWSTNLGQNDPGLATFIVEIDYIALLTEPKDIVSS